MSDPKDRTEAGISAWLVTWEWHGDLNKVDRKIAAVYNPRWSPARVKELVELLYVNSQYSISERIRYADNRKFNPYPAEYGSVGSIRWHWQIMCGHNPFLHARLVDNLVAFQNSDGQETATWIARPRPNPKDVLEALADQETIATD